MAKRAKIDAGVVLGIAREMGLSIQQIAFAVEECKRLKDPGAALSRKQDDLLEMAASMAKELSDLLRAIEVGLPEDSREEFRDRINLELR